MPRRGFKSEADTSAEQSRKKKQGERWQDVLNGVHQEYKAERLLLMPLTPPPVILERRLPTGKWLAIPKSGGPPDLIGTDGHRAYCAEAKSFTGDYWEFGEKQLPSHQAEFFDLWDDLGPITCSLVFLARPSTREAWALFWQDVRVYRNRWLASKAEHGRARPGTGHLSEEAIRRIGLELDYENPRWLPAVQAALRRMAEP